MKLLLHVDTNDYDPESDVIEINGFSLFGLKLKTFQDWNVAGQTGFWYIDGDPYCGTAYDCEINYRGTDAELLLRCLVAKIKEVCEDRFIKLWINDLEVEFTDDDLVCMRKEWLEVFQGNYHDDYDDWKTKMTEEINENNRKLVEEYKRKSLKGN